VARTAAVPEQLAFAAARARVLAAVKPLPAETVALLEARGRALARPVVASTDLPPFRNSSMDGVAVRSGDLAGAAPGRPVTLSMVEVIAAGHLATRALAAGQAARIMTGAELPAGADAVVPVEELDAPAGGGTDAQVRIPRPVRSGENVRDAAADVRRGEVALAAGRDLSAHDLALLAALGEARVAVGCAPNVSVFSTGDELIDVEAPLRPGAIRDSNLPMLCALLGEAGARVARAVRLGDDPTAVAGAIRAALADSDVVITVGGVSAGDFDPVKVALGGEEGIALWRVAMKPGRPQAFGTPGGRLFFGLPGNPASVACVFEVLVRPALRRLQGFAVIERPRLEVRAAEALDSRAGRTDFVRVTLAWREGAWWASPAGPQVSGHLTPQSRAHGLLIVPEGVARLLPGEAAEVSLLRWPETAGT
jgi:molybdopterin molybdotransferase